MGMRRALRLVSGMDGGRDDYAAGRSLAAETRASQPDLAAGLTPGGLPVAEVASPWQPRNLSTIVWNEVFGTVNMPATRAGAMSVPAIAKGRHVLCPKIASTPLRALRGDAEVEPQPSWLYRTDDPVSP